MKDKKFIPFWMEKEKIEIIEAYAECIHNGEVLLERIERAVNYIEEERFIKDGNVGIYVDLDYDDTEHLLDILKGEEK